MNKKIVAVLIGLIVVMLSAFVSADLMNIQGEVTLTNGSSTSGDIQFAIYDNLTAGNIVFDSGNDFNGSIVNGEYDVTLGSNTSLSLVYGNSYYMEIYVNGEDLDFDGNERQMFISNIGEIKRTSTNNNATGNHSFAGGYDSVASGESSVAIGVRATANGTNATAIGPGNFASGQGAFAAGYVSTASGDWGSTAIGSGVVASGDYSTAFGSGTTASGTSSTVFGQSSQATGNYGLAGGYYTISSGDNAPTALGYLTTASGNYGALASGYLTTASGDNGSTALGRETVASGETSFAFGDDVEVGGKNSFVVSLIDQNGFNVTQSNVMVVLGGNVGIGTGSPGEVLDVSGNINASGDVCITGGNCLTDIVPATGDGTGGWINTSTVTRTNLNVDINGTVIINTTTFGDNAAGLRIEDTDSYSQLGAGLLRLVDPGGLSWPYIDFQNVTDSSLFAIGLDDDVFEINTYNSTAGINVVTISMDSFFGINTSNPNEILDVVGNINATGDICISGGNCLSAVSGANQEINQNVNTTGSPIFVSVSSGDWSNVSVTESQISDFGSYLSSESDPLWTANQSNYIVKGTSNAWVVQYQNISNIPTCSGNDKLTYDGSTLSCGTDQTGGISDGTGGWTNTSLNTTTNLNVEVIGGNFTVISGFAGFGVGAPGEAVDVSGNINATGDVCITGGNCLSDIVSQITFNQNLNTTSNVVFNQINISTIAVMAPTDSPGTCDAGNKGAFYMDDTSNKPCFCNSTTWVEFENSSATC